jgi:hypothetical protein
MVMLDEKWTDRINLDAKYQPIMDDRYVFAKRTALRLGIERIGIELPGIELPRIELPGIELPRIELPGIERTGVELPGSNFCRLGFDPQIVRSLFVQSLVDVIKFDPWEFDP